MTEETADVWGAPVSERSQFQIFLRQFARNRTAIVGAFLVFFIATIAIFAPLFAPYDPYLQVYTETLESPSAKHPMGTDDLGRDQMSRVIFGARVSLPIGVISMAVASMVGVLLGLLSGFYGGRTDSIIMRIMDAILAFPGLLLAIFLVAVLGPSLQNAMIAIVIGYIPAFARVTRANVLSVKEEEYTVAARSMGASDWRVMSRHVLLNIMSPIIVQVSLGIGLAILIESSLSFLGLGVQPPTPAWGSMISQGRKFITKAWWLMVFPGIAIFITVLAFNYVGDGLREAFDPRQRRR